MRDRAVVLYEHLDAKSHVTVPELRTDLGGRMHRHTVEAHVARLVKLDVLVPEGRKTTGHRGPRPVRYRVDHRRLHERWWTEFLGSEAVRQEFRRTLRWDLSYLRHKAPGGLDVPVAWLFEAGRVAPRAGPVDVAALEPRVRSAILTVSRWLFAHGWVNAALVFHARLSFLRGWPDGGSGWAEGRSVPAATHKRTSNHPAGADAGPKRRAGRFAGGETEHL